MPGPGLVMVIFLPTWGSSVRPREKPLLTIPLQPSVSFTPFSAVSKSLGTLFSDGDPEAQAALGESCPHLNLLHCSACQHHGSFQRPGSPGSHGAPARGPLAPGGH